MTRGRLFVITGPSGAGLAELAERLFSLRSDLTAVTPITARKMKAGDVDGKGLYFYDLEGWQALRDSGDLLEETMFAGNDYGTSRRLVEEQLRSGKNVLLELEIERAAQIKRNMADAVCVYVSPSEEMLRACYEGSARSRFEAEVRMAEAARIHSLAGFCDCFINSDEPEKAEAEIGALIDRA